MFKKGPRIILILIGLTVVLTQIPVFAEEHAGVEVSGEEAAKIKQAAQNHIDSEIKKKGSFEINDAKAGKIWKLKFDYFHTINKLENGDYFFCADFTEGKDRLDLDFTVSGDDLLVKKAVIHKVDGAAQ